MWHNAMLTRVDGKKFPPLSDFLSGEKKTVKHIDQDAIKARLRAYQDQRNKKEG